MCQCQNPSTSSMSIDVGSTGKMRYFTKSQTPSSESGGSKSENIFIMGANEMKNARNVQNKLRKKANRVRDVSGLKGTRSGRVAPREHFRSRKRRKGDKGPDPFPGPVPLDPKVLAKYSNGPGVTRNKVKTKFRQKEVERREKQIEFAETLAGKAELLLDEDVGVLEGDEIQEFTPTITQTQIQQNVDDISATKGFDLNLPQFGPYKADYTKNGRYLVIGGRRGHVAAFDWTSKNLTCEINVQESVHDVKWLHTENMFAVAQKKWTYIYDNQGIELHCLKRLDNVLKLEFLPYHFLLAAGSESGFLSWVDISLGKLVTQYNAKLGPMGVMCQNPSNAILCAGHGKGIVTMWSPNMREPVAKMLAHRQAVRGVAVDLTGTYLATAGTDRSLKIWDVRQFKCLQNYRISAGASQLEFSGRGLLGVAMGNTVEIFKDCCTTAVKYPYMRHRAFKRITDIHFAPYEDAMGIGHEAGFTSILVPGSGDPNFDALEVNPYQTKRQRREAEVKALLEKIPSELISLDPTQLGDVDVKTFEEKIAEKNSKLHLKPEKIDFEPRYKMKGKGGTAKRFHIKRTVRGEIKMRDLNQKLEEVAQEEQVSRVGKPKQEKKPKSLLDRLK
ncbi:hypothetical protein TCAL_07271 [Tigriopus californicus]|uniref:BING4 C-terminal domain-containing protein n=1 Tax=Tigriopus californicus TaxID=6832 RepID=A0A553NC07_TIGCA|nr:WD repeat-containing protein 46-like [Tigriopus californicus]TRY62945.1 hypothetical protein TCAL_07271 [Tigriopus californicus]|eukprot:TCALIF_07271-PA protein Name:"Similar to WDR46 WD repeat-containing protein 46 (Canis familiaris)" AED:0.05 eAED:0.05 QI:13/1/1/1/0.83/0.85/7/62/615